MKRLIFPILISVSIYPFSTCAQESNTIDEAVSPDSSATVYLQLTEDKPEVSKKAWDILTRMTKFLSGAQEFTIVADMGHEVLQSNGQRLEFGSNITAALRRPSQANVRFETRDGDNATIILDGQTISIFSTRAELYIYDTLRQSGDINASFDHLAVLLGTNDQLRGFFSINLTETLADLVTSAHYVGESRIAGVLCDNLALRSEDEDVQLWIEKGSNPVPRRIIVTYTKLEGQPQFWAQFVEWNFSPEFADSTFTVSAPEHAERVDFFSQ